MSRCALAAVALAALAGGLWPLCPSAGLARIAPAPRSRAGRRSVRVTLPAGGREVARRRALVVALAEGLAVELRAGAQPRVALALAAADQPVLELVVAAARSPAGDVVAALRAVGAAAGGTGAADLATAWAVCEVTGASLAGPADRLAEGLREDDQVRREVAAQLAGPRATAVLLAALPAFGAVMGSALGARPVHLLLHSPVGPLLLAPGLLLELAGVLWTARITARASPP